MKNWYWPGTFLQINVLHVEQEKESIVEKSMVGFKYLKEQLHFNIVDRGSRLVTSIKTISSSSGVMSVSMFVPSRSPGRVPGVEGVPS